MEKYIAKVYDTSQGNHREVYSDERTELFDSVLNLYGFVKNNKLDAGNCYIFGKEDGGQIVIMFNDFRRIKSIRKKKLSPDKHGKLPLFLDAILLNEEQMGILNKL